jgi:carbonic anhydrase
MNKVALLVIILVVAVVLYMLDKERNLRKEDFRHLLTAPSKSVLTHKALVLSCMDYRFINETIDYLYNNVSSNFDYFVLAGSSLGYNQSIKHDTPDDWSKTFEEHIDLAIELHDIKEIIVIDHMDCGYYKAVYKNELNGEKYDVKKERDKHYKNIEKFVGNLWTKYPEILKFEGLLVDLVDRQFEVEHVYTAERTIDGQNINALRYLIMEDEL